MELEIVPLLESHWPGVRAVYAAGIAGRLATFETEPPEWPLWDARFLPACRLAALRGDGVCGWAALSAVSARRVYRGVAEVSVYVAPEEQGRGTGGALLRRLVHASEDAGFWTLQAVMFPENAASVALHRRCGFREVGRRERIGELDGVWRDVVLLERRSERVGT